MTKKISVVLLLLSSWSAIASPKMEISFFFGPSITQTGNIKDLGSPEAATGFEFNYFFKDQHGLGVSFGNEYEFEGGRKFPTLRDGSIQTFDLHYAFRKRFENSNFRLMFTPGVGYQTLYKQSADYFWGYSYYNSLSTSWVLDYKLMLDYIAKEWNEGGEDSNFFIGVGINQIFSLNDDLGGRDITGSRLSGLFRLGFGF